MQAMKTTFRDQGSLQSQEHDPCGMLTNFQIRVKEKFHDFLKLTLGIINYATNENV
jgi:hypothetical protein